jgi:SAM-dependent methyltransferase
MPIVETTAIHRADVFAGMLSRGLDKIAKFLLVPIPAAQGIHIDPELQAAPDPDLWPKDLRAIWRSDEMQLFRNCLRYDGMSIRASVLDELSRFYGLPTEEALRRCLHWEEWSVDEWRAADRSTPEGLTEFYNSVQSWSFDLLWYAYLQAEGYGIPASVLAARFSKEKRLHGRHLDFGSGIGATCQLFARLGFETTAADVSKTLLDFARWRIERHGDPVTLHDLNSGVLATEHYDVVTAIDSLAHVPDFDASARDLHRIIRPGGWLLTDFDVRKQGPNESAWHLYEDELDLELRMQRVGFVRRGKLGNMLLCYERIDPHGLAHSLRSFRDRLVLAQPGGKLTAIGRRIKWPTPDRLRRFIERISKRS